MQISFKESLEEQIARLQRKGDLGEDVIRVKISGDGTCIGKRLKLVNITFTILHEKEAAMSEKDNYVLAILKTTESYDNLKESLSDLTAEMTKISKVKVGGKHYNIEYFLGGDWKFLACVCGLGAATRITHVFGANALAIRGVTSKEYGPLAIVPRVLHHWRKLPTLVNQKSSTAKQLLYLASHHLITWHFVLVEDQQRYKRGGLERFNWSSKNSL